MRVLTNNIKLNHAVNEIFNRIEIRRPFTQVDVLEVFGGNGTSQVIHYAHRSIINSLTAWEISPGAAAQLKELVPDAKVKICDSFQEAHALTPVYDVIIIDSNILQAPRFEHFDPFPAVFKGLKDHAFLLISACGDVGPYYADRERVVRGVLGSRTDVFVRDLDKARAAFYGLSTPSEDDYMGLTGRIMPLTTFPANDMLPVYTDLAIRSGFFTAYHTVMRRSKSVHYILLELKKANSRQQMEANTRDKIERINADNNK